MSISSLGTGLSGLQSFQRAVDTTAFNVANLDTNGFQPQQANFQEQPNGGVNVLISGGPTASPTVSAASQATGSTAAQASAPASVAPSGTDPIKESVDSLEYKYGFDMSAQVVKTADQMLGTLINTSA